jgi:hypothetical protein
LLLFYFNVIWFCRNQKRFIGKVIPLRTAINFISGASLTGNVNKLAAKSCIQEFVIVKHFHMKINPLKPHTI